MDRNNNDEKILQLKAPIIIKSNRERINLNYIHAKNISKILNKFLVIWPSNACKQEGNPSNSQIDELYKNDSDFQEIFVYNTPCYLDDTISKKRKFCNRIRAIYYSFIINNDSIEEYKDQVSRNVNNIIITLSNHLKSIILLFEDEKIISYSKDIQDEVAIHKDGKKQDKEKQDNLVFPIKERTTYHIQKLMYIVPTNLLNELFSFVIKIHFPITCRFTITVDKV